MKTSKKILIGVLYLSLALISKAYNIPSTSDDDYPTRAPVPVAPFRTIREKIANLASNVANIASNIGVGNPSSHNFPDEEPEIPIATGGLHPPPDYNNEGDIFIFDFSNGNFSASLFPDRSVNSQLFPADVFGSANTRPQGNVNNNAFVGNSENQNSHSSFSSGNTGSGFSHGHSIAHPPQSNSFMAAVNGIKDFSLDLLSTFRVMAGPDNVVFSPVSIASLLSLLTLGTNDLSDNEIKVALNIYGTDYHEMYRRILDTVNYSSEGVNITTSARLFVDQNVRVKSSFLDNSDRYYNCSVSYENFAHRPVLSQRRINKWVEEQTYGKITKFISNPIPRQTKMIVASTIYFSGAWKTPFPERMTFERDFNTGDKKVKIPMMTNVFEAPHYFSKTLNVDIVALPYVGDNYALVIILPKEDPSVRSIKQVERELDTFYIDELLRNLTTKQVSITLPKMKLKMKTHLKDNLEQLGVSSIFNPMMSDMSGLSNDKPLFVSQMLHEAVMEIDEKGTVAAAASSVMLDRSGGYPRILVNKPSILFLADMGTGLPLFWSRLKEPVRL